MILLGLVRDDRLRSRDAGAHRAVLVVEHADRLDRLHPVCRRDRVAGAAPLVDPLGARRARLSGAAVDSALARVRVLQPVHRELALRRPARASWPPVFRLRLVIRHDLAGDLRGGGADRRLACANPTRPALDPEAGLGLNGAREIPHATLDGDRSGAPDLAARLALALPRRSGMARLHLPARSDQRAAGRRVLDQRSGRAPGPDSRW